MFGKNLAVIIALGLDKNNIKLYIVATINKRKLKRLLIVKTRIFIMISIELTL